MSSFQNHYSAEDVQEILSAASALEPQADFSGEQLQEMAAELGIAPEVLWEAEKNWQEQRRHQAKQDLARRKWRRQFRQHLLVYGVVNAGLIALDVSIGGTLTWAHYPLLGWGLGVVMNGLLPQAYGAQGISRCGHRSTSLSRSIKSANQSI